MSIAKRLNGKYGATGRGMKVEEKAAMDHLASFVPFGFVAPPLPAFDLNAPPKKTRKPRAKKGE